MSKTHLLSQNLVYIFQLPLVLALYVPCHSVGLSVWLHVHLRNGACCKHFRIAIRMRILVSAVTAEFLAIAATNAHTHTFILSHFGDYLKEVRAGLLVCVWSKVVGLEESSWFMHDWISCDHNLHWTNIAHNSCHCLCLFVLVSGKVTLICS